ncbi:MAG: hypothetical protein SOI44_05945 [Lactimicrobium sp.]|jgi:hypothetical protein|uniref:hypothetical protein n=1 Tax=Lactimicrobium sp. TaxID=2563780 RepID=UPI002F356D3D
MQTERTIESGETTMTQSLPAGLNDQQWSAMMRTLQDHPATMNDYRKVINLLYAWHDGQYSILTITPQAARDYFTQLDEKAKDGTLSANTVHRYKATLRAAGSRMAACPSVFPGYQNPFAGIMHNEIRSRTAYSRDMFADPGDIRALIHILPKLPEKKQILLEFMMHIGLKPKQMESIHVNSFIYNPRNEKELLMAFEDGTYLEKKTTGRRTMPSDRMKLESRSTSGSTTWQVTAVWRFFGDYARKLNAYHPGLGTQKEARPFFLTSRKQAYSYRALHSLLADTCTQAGLNPNAVTPYQLYLYGTIRSKLIFDSLTDQKHLRASMDSSRSRAEKNHILSEMRQLENDFLPLIEAGWIGGWYKEYPADRKVIVDEIAAQMGNDFLSEAVGVKKEQYR